MSPETPRRPASQYAEFLPAAALRTEVLCLWQQKITGEKGQYAHRVLPDGCIDVVLIDERAPLVVGPWTAAFLATFGPGTEIVGARFHPGQAARVLGVPASELLNQRVALRDLWRKAESERFARTAEAESLAAKRTALEVALTSRLAALETADGEINAAMRWLARSPGMRVEQLSRLTGISSRQLQRQFCATVGYGPKTFQSIVRFQRFLNLSVQQRGRVRLAEMSMDAGYADQAHMSREVRRFSGLAPTELLPQAACALQMSSLVKTRPESERGPNRSAWGDASATAEPFQDRR